jgi:hypothetical protein
MFSDGRVFVCMLLSSRRSVYFATDWSHGSKRQGSVCLPVGGHISGFEFIF